MKKIYFFLMMLLLAKTGWSQIILSQWTFEGLSVAATTSTSPSITTGSPQADAGLLTAGSGFSALHSGTTGWTTPTGNGSAKSLSGNTWANGDYWQFVFNTTGYTGISLTWDAVGSTTGPRDFKVQYSINGSTFTDASGTNSTYQLTSTPAWSGGSSSVSATRTIDLTTVTSLNNAATIFIRLVVTSATAINGAAISNIGTSRIDNFTVSAFAALPVSLTDFKVYQQGSSNRMEWNNGTETGMLNYSVERSADGYSFISIGTVSARLNNGSNANYNFTDMSPLPAASYYRINAKEINGASKYSNVIKIDTRSGLADLHIYPNPVTGGELSLQATGLSKGEYKINIFNVNGQLVYDQMLHHNSGAATESVQLPAGLHAGMYNIELSGNDVKLVRSFIVK